MDLHLSFPRLQSLEILRSGLVADAPVTEIDVRAAPIFASPILKRVVISIDQSRIDLRALTSDPNLFPAVTEYEFFLFRFVFPLHETKRYQFVEFAPTKRSTGRRHVYQEPQFNVFTLSGRIGAQSLPIKIGRF